jgi:hypothetical protein
VFFLFTITAAPFFLLFSDVDMILRPTMLAFRVVNMLITERFFFFCLQFDKRHSWREGREYRVRLVC